MNCMKVTRALVAAVSLAAIAFATGCNPAGVSDNTDQNKASIVLSGSTISLEGTNLGEGLGSLVTHNPASILAGTGTIPYLPVEESKLVNGTVPYLTFTFNKTVSKVFGSTLNTGDAAQSLYVFDVIAAAPGYAPKLLSGLPVVNGSTVTFNLPSITQTTGLDDDNKTFVAGNKYLVDFFVQTTDGDFGRVTVAFIPTAADLALGAFGDSNISIYGKTTAGANYYTLYRIDSNRVFYLYQGAAATHTTVAGADEQVYYNGTSYTTFNDYGSRYGNGLGTSGTNSENYDSLDALCSGSSRISPTVNLIWTAVANATEYAIYTTGTEGNAKNWTYITSIPSVTGQETYTYDFPIAGYPITGYRAVRIVPKNAVMIGTEGEIRLVDEINPVTSTYDGQNATNSYTGVASFTNHRHGTAQADGEIVGVGYKNLGVLVQPDALQEAYKITNVAGSLTVETDNLDNRQILPITVAQVEAAIPYDAGNRFYQLGGNAVGVLDAFNQLYVYVHLRCYLTNPGTITYTAAETTIVGNISVTYTDLSGNAMISRGPAPALGSKNTGIVVFSEL